MMIHSHEAPTTTAPATNSESSNRGRIKVCQHWIKGACRFGGECWYSHNGNNHPNTAADESTEAPPQLAAVSNPATNINENTIYSSNLIQPPTPMEPKVDTRSQNSSHTNPGLLRASWGQFPSPNDSLHSGHVNSGINGGSNSGPSGNVNNGVRANINNGSMHGQNPQPPAPPLPPPPPPQVNPQLYSGYDSGGWNTNRSTVVQVPQQQHPERYPPHVYHHPHQGHHPCPVHPTFGHPPPPPQGVPPPPPPPPQMQQIHPCPAHPCPAHPSNFMPAPQQQVPPPRYAYHTVQPPSPPPSAIPHPQSQLPPMMSPHTPPQQGRMQLPPAHPHYHNPHRGIYSVRYYYGFVCYGSGSGSTPARIEDLRIPDGLFGDDGELTDDYETLLALDKNKVKVGVSDEQLREELRDVPYDEHEDELDTEMCTICHDKYHEDTTCRISELPCSHRYHTTCIKTWLSCNTRCPICNWDSWKGGKHVIDVDTISNWSNNTNNTTSTSRRRVLRDTYDMSSGWDDWFYTTVT
eukprot:TRINITY_DN9994_c0_g1_i2.p1 TRINITY_DN9994_c0_g1~~TRINITY_DN9994_c0_g1_i2.p1  ORF type:complete len:520 (+),score=86.67 TRINITY_DN9994_c0_g1_i2:139-1698(+)